MKEGAAGRRDFIKKAIATSGAIFVQSVTGEAHASEVSDAAAKHGGAEMMPARRRSEERQRELISKWNETTELVSPSVYVHYLHDGNTRGFKALDALEHAFDKVMREVKEATVAVDVPAVWSLYNMGYVVKTRESLFTIDIKHRRDSEFAKMVELVGTDPVCDGENLRRIGDVFLEIWFLWGRGCFSWSWRMLKWMSW
jgi:hypothetical protein